MREHEFAARSGFLRRTVPVAIAAVSLAAFSGAVWFAYEQGVRRGLQFSPPLVRADPSPAKIAPADPGGLEVPNQDRQVFDALSARDEPPRVEQLLPPPEEPLPPPPPEPEVAVVAAVAEPPPPAGPVAPDEGAQAALAVPVPAPEALQPPAQEPQEAAPSPDAVAEAPPLELFPDVSPAAGPAAEIPAAQAEQPPQALLPAEPQRAPPPQAVAAAPGLSPAEAYRVQLGAYRSAERAMEGWETLLRDHREILGDLDPVVMTAEIAGSGMFHRLQAGPLATEADAEGLCQRLEDAGAGCLVVNP